MKIVNVAATGEGGGKVLVTVELESQLEDAHMERYLTMTYGWGETNEGFGVSRKPLSPTFEAEARAWQDGSEPWLFDNRPDGQYCTTHEDIEGCRKDHKACVLTSQEAEDQWAARAVQED